MFYVGDKFKLMNEIKQYFPNNINKFIEPFTGGGTVFLNTDAKKYLLNDIDKDVCRLHKYLLKQSKNPNLFYKTLTKTINKYGLSKSFIQDIVPKKLKVKYKKTYYAKFNKISYNNLKKDYNLQTRKKPLYLYLLLIYGFNRMLRFNGKGEFNVPVGNVDFNLNVKNAIDNYFDFVSNKKIFWFNKDFKQFFSNIEFEKNDFIYLDPPYLISFSEYNKLWNSKREKELLNILDELNDKGIKFAISNIVLHKDKENSIFKNWMKKYNVYRIKSNYISYHNNSKKLIDEVLVTNY